MLTFIQVIRRNAELPQSHEMKRRALQNLERYDEIIKALNELPDGRQYIMFHL
jgi:hypothetical protein